MATSRLAHAKITQGSRPAARMEHMGDEKQKGEPTYRSYLVRLRLVENAGQPVWRATLQVPGEARERRFESLGALCAYLEQNLNPKKKKT